MKYNWGISGLKLIAAYLVVCCHFGAHPALSWLCFYAVPVFMMLAFALGGRLWALDANKCVWGTILRRIMRLTIPFVAWSVFYWTIEFFRGAVGIKALIGQLLIGHVVCVPLYFFVLLLWFTIGFFFVRLFVRKVLMRRALAVIVVVSCYIMQYTGFNETMINFLPPVLSAGRYPLGRIVELLPVAIIGLGCTRLMVCNLDARLTRFLLVSCALVFWASYWIGSHSELQGFGYQGVHLLMGAMALTVFCWVVGANFNLPRSVESVVRTLSTPLMGVYCVHVLVGHCLAHLGLGHGAKMSFFVYISSIAISGLLARTKVRALVV